MAALKTRAVEAAVDLVGTEGLRALTHARVDERAGLPRGSTSNYFRSHQALYGDHRATGAVYGSQPQRRTPEALSRERAAMEGLVVVALARLGARQPHPAVMAVAACFEGLLLHRIARHDPTDPRPTLDLVVRAALA